MIELHPFGNYVPKHPKYLIIGSFPGKGTGHDWFYGSTRSQFWPILREVYSLPLSNKSEKEYLFSVLGIAITDIIISCERKFNSNLDTNLTNIVINNEIPNILKRNDIRKTFFTSKFVENLFRKNFRDFIKDNPQIELVPLPSPSPRYAGMTKSDKISRYKELLPDLN